MVETRKPRWPWPFAACFALRGDLRTFAGTCTRVTNGHEYSVARTTAEIYSERWCRQLAHPPPRRINFISTALSCPPFLQIRCLTLLKFRKTTKSLYKDWSLCTILILENKILEDTRGDKKKRFVLSFFSSSSAENRFWNFVKIDKNRQIAIVGKIQRSKNCIGNLKISPLPYDWNLIPGKFSANTAEQPRNVARAGWQTVVATGY